MVCLTGLPKELTSLPEKCKVVFDGSSYFIVPADHELERGEEVIKDFDDIDIADKYCERANFKNRSI